MLDDTMGALYASLTSTYSDAQALKWGQKSWLLERNACQNAQCLEVAYTQRIAFLQSALSADPELRKWTGNYVRYTNGKKDANSAVINVIALNASRFHIDGTSVWVSPGKSGTAHTGALRGFGELKGAVISETVKNELCSAKLRLTAPGTLRVEGEAGCGGMNVTFNGEYRR